MTNPSRLFLLLILPLAAACAGLFLFFVYRLDLALEANMARRAEGMAAIMSRAVAPAVDFENPTSIERSLRSLEASPDIAYAVVLRQTGELLAGLNAEHRPPVIERPAGGPELRWTADTLHVFAPVETSGGARATVALGYGLRALREQRDTNTAVVGMATGVVLLGGAVFCYLLAHYVARRRAAEAAQARSEASFRALIEALPDAILIERDEVVVYANPAAVQALAVGGAGDLRGQPVSTILRMESATPSGLDLTRVHGDATVVHMADATLVRRDGSTLPAELFALPLIVDSAPAGVLVARDLTEQRRVQAQLMRADRMASMGTMAAGIAHEINNPVTFISANVRFALERVEAEAHACGEEIRLALCEAQEGIERVHHIVMSLKTYTRGDEVTVGAVDVERSLDAAINMVRGEVRARAELVRVAGGVPLVHGNEARLVQVFVNLLTNAAQAIRPGSPAAQQVTVATALLPDGRVEVAVRDTGSGIPPENLPRLFDPFFTTKPVGVGTGLGLWICQGIVTSLGGEIAVRSKLGGGTEFCVRLAAARPEEPNLTGSRSRSSAPPGDVDGDDRWDETETRGQPRLLVIDDEPRIGHSIRRLYARDFNVTCETSGPRALELLARDPNFDVILCDLMMPELSGPEVYRGVQAISPRLARRIIFLTGGGTPEVNAFLESLTNPVVPKPFDADDLLATIQRVQLRTGERASGSAVAARQ